VPALEAEVDASVGGRRCLGPSISKRSLLLLCEKKIVSIVVIGGCGKECKAVHRAPICERERLSCLGFPTRERFE